ncbi:MAG: hypothetical protein HYY02_08375 [Chloroflexi bacterium]|nr:hypothetical protein [Chloroflexota bacterium]
MMRRRQVVLLVTAVLIWVSLAFPYWTAAMKAPAYPEQFLTLQLYSYKYDGDVDEWNRVGRLVGVRVPPPLPDGFFTFFSLAVGLAGLLALAAAFQERLLLPAALYPLLLLLALAAWGQYSLYEYGHSLDPLRPLRYLEPFTPPLVGVLTLGKIVTYHVPNLGSALFVAGAALVNLQAWRARHNSHRRPVLEAALA